MTTAGSSGASKAKDDKSEAPVRKKRYSITIDTGSQNLRSTKASLYQPDLEVLAESIKKALVENFESVRVKVETSPNFQEWCGLAERGLSGNTRLVDLGGVPYMMDPKYHNTKYQLPDVVKTCDMPGPTLIIGSGAASPTVVGKNAELIVNALVPGPAHNRFVKIDKPTEDEASDEEIEQQGTESEDELMVNKTQIADNEPKPKAQVFRKTSGGDKSPTPTKTPTNGDDESNPRDMKEMKEEESGKDYKKKQKEPSMVPFVGSYPSEETGCLMNLFLCDGKPGKVIYIKVSKRKGRANFTNTIREGMKTCKGVGKDHQVGMGGIFKLNKGKVKGHIMPDFNPKKMDENNSQEVNNWLRFFEFGPHLLMFTSLVTDDPTTNNSMHLRLEHTHFYSLEKNAHEGGHYHYDVTPEEVEYEGYFSLAEKIYRVEDAYNLVAKNEQPHDALVNRIKT